MALREDAMQRRKPTYTPPKRNSRAKRKRATAERMKRLGLNQPNKKPELTLNAKRAIRLTRTRKTRKGAGGNSGARPERLSKQSPEEVLREQERIARNKELGRRGGKHSTAHRQTSTDHGRNR